MHAERTPTGHAAATTKQIKEKAIELGADMVGVCRLQPHMIDLGEDVPHEFVIACCVAEDYEKVMQGADAVEEEAMRTYVRCTQISNELAAHIRSLGYPARAHHNGGSEVQAIPVFIRLASASLGATAA